VILTANPKRKGLLIQNTGTTVIKLTFSATDPTQTVYDVALKGGTDADDGMGATWIDPHFVGAVRGISSAAGGTVVITEFTLGNPDWSRASDFGTGTV
jgi:hypothetical protein